MRKHLHPLWSLLLFFMIFGTGFVVGLQVSAVEASSPLQSGESVYVQRFVRIWDLVHEGFFEQPVDSEVLIQGAINGMLETLGDQHTSYMPPDEFEMFSQDLSGSYSGIGALVEAEDDKLLIVSPFDGSPAEAAGLLPGDEIKKVDETLVSEFDDPLSAIALVRGPTGTPVRLLILRDGQEFEVTIVRETIPLVSASGEMREDGIAYVRIASFGYDTVEELEATLEELLAQNPKGLVVDLRGNPGGSLDAALGVTSQFIGDGQIMIEEWGDGRREAYTARRGGLATDRDLPLVVLVDGGSASASEIVAGAIQDRGRGQILGETTYGKGTVQNWHNLGPEDGGVRITIARWLTPNGTWIHEEGITPDITVELTDAQRQAERDFQLESAEKLLLGQPLPKLPQSRQNRGCCLGVY
ncbi:MAG: S41 family peptidase [Ardenticatenaceae bacterium]